MKHVQPTSKGKQEALERLSFLLTYSDLLAKRGYSRAEIKSMSYKTARRLLSPVHFMEFSPREKKLRQVRASVQVQLILLLVCAVIIALVFNLQSSYPQ